MSATARKNNNTNNHKNTEKEEYKRHGRTSLLPSNNCNNYCNIVQSLL